ncbi:hypothetical protein IMG5_201750 [Ichthyophthirius multifiliis]|uniref:Uncharacterized protein n=1 Tax=Ichthyophthirius multifiliis TaxID=5932 RepID=G0R5X3_ICHMU|nr:hypothetical protein IMG5_201750 [Ichthyophthirius multifiliis]EGR27150.1 hypothetical protein IMG5_201750 [Ichthyophthirius multifiliis]|eukprot:XP_004024034.1 hypothetical protein IMG5_201750 [Ichthyophthirius multifiliis]
MKGAFECLNILIQNLYKFKQYDLKLYEKNAIDILDISTFNQFNDIIFFYKNSLIGPSKEKYKKACTEDKEMLMECVLLSDCFKKHQNFRYCVTDGVDKECKALRYDHFLCRRSQVFWQKSFSRDDPR